MLSGESSGGSSGSTSSRRPFPIGLNPVKSGTSEPFCYGDEKDPRLGRAQKMKEFLYAKCRLGNPEDDDPSTFVDFDIDPPITTVRMCDVSASGEEIPLPAADVLSQLKDLCLNIQRRRLNLAVKNEASILRADDHEYAQEAINFYNTTHGTDYGLTQTLGSLNGMYDGFWVHCNFRAAPRGFPSYEKTFFAELHRTGLGQVVKSVNVLEDFQQSELIVGCEMCGDKLLHPRNNFEAGNHSRLLANVG